MGSVLILLYDLFVLPLSVFGFSQQVFAEVMAALTSVFWSVDIVLNFFVGYHLPDGCTEMRPRRIACRYLRTWFGVDVLLVSIDIFLQWVLEDGVEVGRIG